MSSVPIAVPEEASRRPRQRTRDKRDVQKFDLRFVGINSAALLALVVIAAIAAWPIYASTSFVILVVVSVLLGIGIAVAGLLRGFSWLTLVLITLGAYLVVGVPLAVPTSLTGIGAIGGGWLDLVSATVFGWKELVTISIPVGNYQTLLVPALIVFLAGTVAALSFAWRSTRLYFLALPVVFLMVLFGIAFGSSSASEETSVLGLGVLAPREFALGLVAFLIGFAFLLWRVQYARGRALRSAQVTAGIRQARPALASLARRIALAVVIVLVAVGVSAAVTPAIGVDKSREVLRTNVERDINLREYVSPLSQYRTYFESDLYNAELFTVAADAPLETRLRLAVLSYYDGQVFRVIDPNATGVSEASSFVRVPYRLTPDTAGSEEREVTVTVGAYSGVWVPTVGELLSADFDGDDSAALEENFFYNSTTASAVELGTLDEGDTYTLEAAVAPLADGLASLGSPAMSGDATDPTYPKALIDWVAAQEDVGADGEGLQKLIDRMRARGYLSHSISAVVDETNKPWIDGLTALNDKYAYKQALAGHSTDRIGTLFQALLDKQSSTLDTEDIQLVSAVGDNEQFAVAAALLAKYLGFESRVVLGFDLGATADPKSAIKPCVDGVCRGQNLSAWVEVRGTDGSWHSADVTPQFENALDPVNKSTKDPENGTAVTPDTATDQLPPDANPSGGDETDRPNSEDPIDLTWLVTTLKIVGISLLGILILLAPFITILLAKARRRKDRRTAVKAEERIVGGWDEYVDAALDHGRPAPTNETRVELARTYRSPQGVVLANIADRAVFGATDPEDGESDIFWQIVEDERRQFSSGMTRWQRWRAAVSLKSFTRYLGAQLTKGKR
jgi:hypothetical protein